MLDAFIIDRIRREREALRDQRPVLQIEIPQREPEPQPLRPLETDREHGIVDVDFSI